MRGVLWWVRVGFLVAATWFCVGCATKAAPTSEDPWERMNRGTFAFNEAADRWVIEPVAKGWDFVLPELVQTGVESFFENLKMPVFFMNNMLQGEPEQALLEVFRFVLNSTFGVAGFWDAASHANWPHYPEDFGLTLGHWGVSHGPYLVLPIFGASTVRDTVGLGVDSVAGVYGFFVPIYVPVAARATELLNRRAIFLEEIAQSRAEAFDFYVFVRSAYLQNRRHRLLGGAPAEEQPGQGSAFDDEDLYYFDEEFDEDPSDLPDDDEADEDEGAEEAEGAEGGGTEHDFESQD